MALDLSALDEPDESEGVVGGRPLLLKTADIDEDPNQPRTEFDLTEMRAGIRGRLAAGKPPIKQPVSVRPNDASPGRWLLNDGARRLRSCIAEGIEEIPAWVDEDHDDYDQVLVNNQHEKLKAMELAIFIRKKLSAGDSKSVIADHLGYDNAVITHHLALIDAPDCVMDAYRNGKTKSARTLYELRNAHERWPQQVDAWVESVDEVTRPQIMALAKRLETSDFGGTPGPDHTIETPSAASQIDHGEGGQPLLSGTGQDQDLGDDAAEDAARINASADGPPIGGLAESQRTRKNEYPADGEQGAAAVDGPVVDVGVDCMDIGEMTSWPTWNPSREQERMTRPLLLVEFDGRAAAVLLNRRPTKPGRIFVRFQDGGGDHQVDAGVCKIKLLTEGGEVG